ncbi:MAG: M1 family aminopeptidase [Ferruginibacter sp.]|nr:M1 family aminopeptidase [Ferruginibacter sp.]
MFWQLTRFEISFLLKKPITWIAIVAFLLMGFALGSIRNLPFAGIYRNAPYLIAYFTGVVALGTIFTITISAAQSFLKDHAANFESILFTTPVKKSQYLGAQVSAVFLVVIFSFSFAIIGLIIGQYMPGLPAAELNEFRFSYYLWPFLVLVIPNIIFCIAVTGSIALLTRSAVSVYTGGLLIYVCYIAGSIISNSPLIATASPATPEAMSLVAKLDPFGLAAFFEQTRYWSILERNQQVIKLQDEMLLNRVLYLFISVGIMAFTYLKFSFRKSKRFGKSEDALLAKHASIEQYTPLIPDLNPVSWCLQSAWSLSRIDVKLIVSGIPFVIIMILLTALLLVDLSSEIDAGVRNAARYADTPLMVTGILSNIPLIGPFVLLFYSNELFWKMQTSGMTGIATTNPVPDAIFYLSKILVLAIISVFMTCWSICIGLVLQIAYDFPVIEIGVYASLLYYVFLPLLMLSMLLVFVQNLSTNKYLALVVSAIVTLVFNSGFGTTLGIVHPLLRFADMPTIPYHHLNGLGEYRTAFSWQMINEISLVIVLAAITIYTWNRNYERSFLQRLKSNKMVTQFVVPALALGIFIITSGFIYYETSIKNPVQSSDEKFNWREKYERSFKKYAGLPQPSVTLVQASVDLFPGEHLYKVSGAYTMLNKTKFPIDSLLLYFDPNIHLEKMSVPGARMVLEDQQYHHQLYVLTNALQPGDSIKVKYDFSSSWSPFTKHTPFNSIIANGSFIRMSRYFPQPGYQESNEIDLPAERKRRGLPIAPALRGVTASEKDPSNFIDLDMVVSTDSGQTAIGSGELVQSWTAKGRNYFHYKTGAAIPFRFAFSSARYSVKKVKYKGISIEVFYAAAHHQNVDRLLKNAQQTLDYASSNFGSYSFKTIRFAEISDFATGFAATAYPSVIYMKEDMGFNADLRKHDEHDVINQLAGHELSHLWWGSAQLSPDQREGYGLMTETLAQYTELMLYRKAHGPSRAIEIAKVHLDLYLAARGYQAELPLYRADFESPHLIYNKGMVVMHQLEQLLGEPVVNKALAYFFNQHKFPNTPPTSPDLLNAFYRFSPPALYGKIDELFKRVITFQSKLSSAVLKSGDKGKVTLTFSGELRKFELTEDGRKLEIAADSVVDIGITMRSGKMEFVTVAVKDNRFAGTINLASKPVSISLDPLLKNLDDFPNDNVKLFPGN